jgi:hypothetical protein
VNFPADWSVRLEERSLSARRATAAADLRPSVKRFGRPRDQGPIRRSRPDPVEHEASVVLVVRSGYRIRRRELKPCQATVLRRLLSSEPLGMAFSGVTADAEGVEAWFRDWSAWGVFSKVTVDPAPTGDTPPSPSTAR